MRIAETIKQAREGLGLTQEDLAEKCGVSRQAVSKWELGASLPSPENLQTLTKVLNVTFSQAEPEPPAPGTAPVPWKPIALILGGLLAAALTLVLWLSLSPLPGGIISLERCTLASSLSQVQNSPEPAITGVYFFQEDGTPLDPDLGDGWKSFSTGQRVYLLVSFRQGTEAGVQGVSLFATPTGTETYDEREQLAVRAVYDRTFVLFPLDFPENTFYHLDVVLECDGDRRVTETLQIAAVSSEPSEEGPGQSGGADPAKPDSAVHAEEKSSAAPET